MKLSDLQDCGSPPSVKAPSAIATQIPVLPTKPPPVTYDKGIQTIPIPESTQATSAGDNDHADEEIQAKTAIATESEIRARVLKEIEMQKEIDRLEEEERMKEEEIAKNRGLDPADLQSLYASDEFQSFLDHSTKVVERALNDHYDYLRDYTIGDGDAGL